jgi:hypothetical protein
MRNVATGRGHEMPLCEMNVSYRKAAIAAARRLKMQKGQH